MREFSKKQYVAFAETNIESIVYVAEAVAALVRIASYQMRLALSPPVRTATMQRVNALR